MATNPFLPGGNYGWVYNGSTGGAYDTDYVKNYLSPEIPQGEYETYLSKLGLGGFDRRSDAARGMYQRTNTGYQAATLQNPMLTYRQYLNDNLGTDFFKNTLASMTADQLGDRPNLWASRARTVGRA